ncbi:MAG: hypothetical protein GXY52_00110 [Chloroflexi bacterium]|nr:hypothetical protein [Chloroflexota bacterium]
MSDAPVREYTLHPYFHRRWEHVGRALALDTSSLLAYQAWRLRAIARLKELIGYDTLESCDLSPVVTERLEMDGYIRERIELQVEPELWMPVYALLPAGKASYPAAIAPHGHGSGGKYAVAGRRDIPEIAGTIEEHNYDYGVQLTQRGIAAFCPDARGFGERQELSVRNSLLNSSCRDINAMAYPLGQTITGMWAYDLHRLADYIQTRSDCQPGKLACVGLSGGGLQTLWATALDERIRCAVISGYFYGYRESLLEMCENCWCNYVPHLYETMDMGDIAALIAPRPLMIESGDEDPLNGASGLANVTSQVEITRRAYRLMGANDQLYHSVGHGAHRWYGHEALPWLVEQLSA